MEFEHVTGVILLLNYVSCGESALRFSRQTNNWTDASAYCQEFGGNLATVTDLDDLQKWVTNNQISSSFLAEGMEVWVGARLLTSPWKWEGESGTIYKDANSYEKMGCYNEEFWFQGTQLVNITPNTCLQYCSWQGLVGLQEDRCLCEEDIGNASMIRRGGVCHIPCTGNPREMCGGLQGISVFRPAAHKVTWTGDENTKHNCVLLRKRSRDPEWHLKASNCALQTRYLCGFRDHPKCGDYHTCLRWSTDQATWAESRSRCQATNGHLAELVNGFGDYSRDLYNLPPGSYWLSLRRNKSWTWINGSVISPSEFFVQSRYPVTNETCAVVQNIHGVYGLSPRPCHLNRRFLCEYDFEDKPLVTRSPKPKIEAQTAETNTKMATRLYEATWRRNPFFDLFEINNNTISLESQTGTSWSDNSSAVLNTCMYLLLGFVSGMVCVLILGLLVYLFFRCRQPDPKKHRPLSEARGRHDNQSVTYSSKDDSIHIPSPPSDITYDSVYDGESPFRRNQRLIRMGSANTWRPAVQTRRQRTETPNSLPSDYAWRGMIDGNVEIINTQLRHHNPTNRSAGNYCEVEYDFHQPASDHGTQSPARFKVSVNNASRINDEITTDLDALENHYDIPERPIRETLEPTRRNSSTSGTRRSSALSTGSDVIFPKFLDLENHMDEFSNEENIYASIKKTFQKIERDLNNSKDNQKEESPSKLG